MPQLCMSIYINLYKRIYINLYKRGYITIVDVLPNPRSSWLLKCGSERAERAAVAAQVVVCGDAC